MENIFRLYFREGRFTALSRKTVCYYCSKLGTVVSPSLLAWVQDLFYHGLSNRLIGQRVWSALRDSFRSLWFPFICQRPKSQSECCWTHLPGEETQPWAILVIVLYISLRVFHVADQLPWKLTWGWGFDCRKFIGGGGEVNALEINIPMESKGSRLGQRLNHDAVVTRASANPIRSSSAGMALQNCLKLARSLVFVSSHQPITEH